MSGFDVTAGSGSVRFSVHVQPRASRSGITGIHGSALKVRLSAPPVDGAANSELVELLAMRLGVSKRAVRIVAGLASRGKTVEVDGVSPESVHALAEGAEKG